MAKSFDRGQTARTAQADQGRYFSQFPFCVMGHKLLKMVYDVVLFTEINDRATESAEQDQTTRMCRLILVYIFFCKIKTVVANSRVKS